eukprot:TRINITY_DN32015_c0_g1_i1.p1 TRINITY_DN32015_c0_g1~~TRINITY_DN32015_c0_g1_i1.p1  ORF type:complete len:501 (-),score=91.18 TRINITY_DN32015_c0_g1_i1:355-1857(-)
MTVRSRANTRGVMKSSLVSKHTTCAALQMHYEHVRELGKGGYGSVDLVRERSSGHERVCKSVNIAGFCPAILALMKKEIELLCSLDHPGVVKLFEYAEDVEQQKLLLILEYLPGGSCDSLLKNEQGPPSEELVGRLVYQLLVSLEYCHSQGIVHRDIKPENMMLSRESSVDGRADCKLIDFGLARKCQPGKDLCVGTAPYTPPEMIRFESHTTKCDIWSVGVSAFELLTGKRPFGTPATEDAKLGIKQPVFERIKNFRDFDRDIELSQFPWWQCRSSDAQEFVAWLLNPDPHQRPTAAEALEHPWMERHAPQLPELSGEIARSLAHFTQVPAVTRCCLLIVAGRLRIPDPEALGAAFLSADVDGDGKISRDDLEEALENMQGSWWWNPAAQVDVDRVMDAADFDHSGGMSYTECVAACICARHGSDEELTRQAFHAMDADRDGWVHVDDIRRLFRERDAYMLRDLPQDRPFDLGEWCACVEAHRSAKPKSSHRRVKSSCV